MSNEDVLFLDVATRVRVRSDHDKELDRVNLADERIQVLGRLRLGFETFCAYACLFGIGAVSYGWISCLPTKICCTKLWTVVKKGLPTGKHVESKVACSCHWQHFELGCLGCLKLVMVDCCS